MDFNQAIDSHVRWRVNLARHIANPDRHIDADQVSGDQNCELGKWLHGDGQKFSSIPGYATLVAEHAQFHREAGDIIRAVNAGQDVSAAIALGSASKFSKASMAVVSQLVAMKNLVK